MISNSLADAYQARVDAGQPLFKVKPMFAVKTNIEGLTLPPVK
jgi:hypothetical protein